MTNFTKNKAFENLGKALSKFFASTEPIRIDTNGINNNGDLRFETTSPAAADILRYAMKLERPIQKYASSITGEWLVIKNLQEFLEISHDMLRNRKVMMIQHETFGMKQSKDRKKTIYSFHISFLKGISNSKYKNARTPTPQSPSISISNRMAQFPNI